MHLLIDVVNIFTWLEARVWLIPAPPPPFSLPISSQWQSITRQLVSFIPAEIVHVYTYVTFRNHPPSELVQ